MAPPPPPGPTDRQTARPPCAVGQWRAPQGATPGEQIERALQSLQGLDIAPDAFHREDDPAHRYNGLLQSCDAGQISRFDEQLGSVSAQLRAMKTDEIAARLETLYGQAYSLGPDKGRMTITDPRAARLLEFWIAAIDRLAMEDQQFLSRVKTGRIERVLALNSPRMLPESRATLYRLAGGEISFADFYRQETERGLNLARRYAGEEPEVYMGQPQFQSSAEESAFVDALYGRERGLQLASGEFREERVLPFLTEQGLLEVYRAYSRLSSSELVGEVVSLIFRWQVSGEPEERRGLLGQVWAASFVFEKRGFDFETEADKRFAFLYSLMGASDPEAALMARGTSVEATASRLDDYEAAYRFREDSARLEIETVRRLEEEWRTLREAATARMRITPAQRKELEEAIALLDRLGPTESSPEYPVDHPIIGFVAAVSLVLMGPGGIPQPPEAGGALSGGAWQALKRAAAGASLLKKMMKSLPQPPTFDPMDRPDPDQAVPI